jgi:hypothetical protein
MTDGDAAATMPPQEPAAGQASSPSVDSRQQKLVDAARDGWLVLQALAFGYRQNVARIDFLQQGLDALSVLTSIWLVAVLWGVQELVPQGPYRGHLASLIGVIGTLLSLAVVSLVIMSWRSEWRGTSERHRELADIAAKLADRYREIFQAQQLDEGKLKRVDSDRRGFESEQSRPLGTMPDWCVPEGFQHVGKRHPDQNIRCNSCNRLWNDLQSLPWWRWWIIFGKCENCGFVK